MLLAEVTFWTAFWLLVIFVPLVLLWAFALVDLFRREDVSGLAKVLWLLFILILPLLGMLIYFIARPEEEQVLAPAGSSEGQADVADSLARLADLRSQGVLSEEEFNQGKAQVLGLQPTPPDSGTD